MKPLIDVRALHKPLKDAGIVPDHCRLLSMQVGVTGALSITYEVFVTVDQLAALGRVFQAVSSQLDDADG